MGTEAAVVIGAFAVSAAGCAAMLRYALRRSLLAEPTARSSHEVPTPTGGGVGIVAAVLGSMLFLALGGRLEWGPFAALFGGGLLVAAVGFADDHRHIPARWRLLAHFSAAAAVVAAAGGLAPIRLGAYSFDLGWAGHVLAAVAVVWVLNLYNFMDGIDGIAGVQGVTAGGVGAALLWWSGNQGGAMLMAVLAVSCAGFLLWNWPPARIFMGDVASGFLGLLFGAALVGCSGGKALSVWVWGILLGVFLVDATVTLLARLWSGQRVYEAHRSHAYQYAARRFGGHRPVTVGVALVNLLWLGPLAWLAHTRPADAWWIAAVALAPLGAVVIRLRGLRGLE